MGGYGKVKRVFRQAGQWLCYVVKAKQRTNKLKQSKAASTVTTLFKSKKLLTVT